MRKILYCLTAAAAALLPLASCSIDAARDEVPATAISFSAFTEGMTRATPITSAGGSGSSALGDIRVLAIFAGNNSSSHKLWTPFLYDTFSGSTNEYSSAVPYYWPNGNINGNRFLAFMAFNGYVEGGTGTMGTTRLGGEVYCNLGFPNGANNGDYRQELMPGIRGITIPTKASEQFDLMLAKTDLVDCKSNDKTRPQALNFRHTLSQIKVEAKNMAPNVTVEVLGCRIVNVNDRATLTFPQSFTSVNNPGTSTNDILRLEQTWMDYSKSVTNPAFEALATAESQKVTLNSTAFQNIMLGSGSGSFMLLPQNNADRGGVSAWGGGTTSDGAYLSILCRITQKNGTTSGSYQLYPPADGKYAYTAVPIAPDWLPGRTYTYQVTFFNGTGGGGGKIDPLPTGGGNEPSGVLDQNPGTGGTSVVGGALSLNVSVSTWGTGSNNEIQPN